MPSSQVTFMFKLEIPKPVRLASGVICSAFLTVPCTAATNISRSVYGAYHVPERDRDILVAAGHGMGHKLGIK